MNELQKLNEQQVNLLLTQSIDQAWESICITDVQLEFPGPRFVYVNHGYEKIMGYTSEEAIGQTPRIHQGPLTDRKVLERLKQNLKRGEPFHGETINYRKDGQAFWLEWKIFPVRNDAGAITNFIAFQRDVSELKAAEQRLKDFHSILSHELRSPLASILGSLKLLDGFKMDPNSETGQELTSIAIDSTERLVRLINELLDLTKLEQGEVSLDLKKTTADALVVTAANNMVSFQAQHHVKIVTSTIKANVAVDPDKIVQVLVNLISNAMKFSPPGGTVKVSVSPKNAGDLRFAVTDQGPGISEENKLKLFTKFQQLAPEDGIHRQGTGLGLAIAKTIIERHGGSLGVDSEVGRGSTFYFELPEISAEESETRTRTVATVLVVGNEETLVTLIKFFLGQEKYKVSVASTLADARVALVNLRYDACIADVQLPDGSGLMLLREMNLNPGTKPIPFLVTSAARSESVGYRSPLLVECFSKPFELSELDSLLNRMKVREINGIVLCEQAEVFWQVLPVIMGADRIKLIDCSHETAINDFIEATTFAYVGLKFDGSPTAHERLIQIALQPANAKTLFLCCDNKFDETVSQCLGNLVLQQSDTACLSEKQFIDKLLYGLRLEQ